MTSRWCLALAWCWSLTCVGFAAPAPDAEEHGGAPFLRYSVGEFGHDAYTELCVAEDGMVLAYRLFPEPTKCYRLAASLEQISRLRDMLQAVDFATLPSWVLDPAPTPGWGTPAEIDWLRQGRVVRSRVRMANPVDPWLEPYERLSLAQVQEWARFREVQVLLDEMTGMEHLAAWVQSAGLAELEGQECGWLPPCDLALVVWPTVTTAEAQQPLEIRLLLVNADSEDVMVPLEMKWRAEMSSVAGAGTPAPEHASGATTPWAWIEEPQPDRPEGQGEALLLKAGGFLSYRGRVQVGAPGIWRLRVTAEARLLHRYNWLRVPPVIAGRIVSLNEPLLRVDGTQ